MNLSTALELVIADYRVAEPKYTEGLEDIDVVQLWLDDGFDHADVDHGYASGHFDRDTADAYHLVLEVGHGPIQTVLLGTDEQAAEVDAAIAAMYGPAFDTSR